MTKQQILNDIIAPAVEALGYEFVGCEFLSQGRHSLVRVYIDKPEGITVDDCALVSQQISAALDVADPIAGEYQLEVSSPGLDRPIFNLAQMQACIGKKIKLRLSEADNGRKNFCGLLIEINSNVLIIKIDNELYEVNFAKVDKAQLEPEW